MAWTPHVGDIVRKNKNALFYGGRFARIVESYVDSFAYQMLDGEQERGMCQPVDVDFILRPGDKVRLLPHTEWSYLGGMAGSIRVASHIGERGGVQSVVVVGGFNWPLSAVERIIEEAKPESPKQESVPRPIGRRLAMDMLPAEREQYDEMLKRREPKPVVNCETDADKSMHNTRLQAKIEAKRQIVMSIEAQIDDLSEQRK